MVVAGRVQGVFFRDECRRRAAAAGVTGWISNRGDGRVEAWFEGPGDAVDALVAWCREGPSRARVQSVEVAQEAPAGHRGFDIR